MNEFVVKNGFISQGNSVVNATFSAATYLGLPSSVFTGGTVTGSTVFTNGATTNTLSATTISGGTLLSGSTNLNSIFAPIIHSHTQYATLSSATFTGQVNIQNLSATTISASTLNSVILLSGGTNLYNIFATSGSSDITRVQPGSNITTGGTGNFPIINLVSSPIVNNITFSGTAIGNILSANTISGGTISYGGVDLIDKFALKGTTSLPIKSGKVIGASFTGAPLSTNVVFSIPFTSDYSIAISGEINRTWSIQSKTSSGFTINSNANIGFIGKNVYWTASEVGEQSFGLEQKNGILTGTTFFGNPLLANVVFTTPFTSDYSIAISGEVNRTWTIQSKTSSGFTVNSNANRNIGSSKVFWMATRVGEN